VPSITLNGEPTAVAAGATVEAVVRALGHDPAVPGVAVAVDGEVVRRVDWPARALVDGDRVEVVTAVQGGAR
jgi:sulfur carrier protein